MIAEVVDLKVVDRTMEADPKAAHKSVWPEWVTQGGENPVLGEVEKD